MAFSLVSLAAAVAVGFPGAAAVAQDAEAGASPGPHPFPAASWRTVYDYDCPTRSVGFTLSVVRGRAKLEALDLGAASASENVGTANAALARIHFDKILVTCAGSNATINLMGWEVRSDETLGDARRVTIQSPSASSSDLIIDPL